MLMRRTATPWSGSTTVVKHAHCLPFSFNDVLSCSTPFKGRKKQAVYWNKGDEFVEKRLAGE